MLNFSLQTLNFISKQLINKQQRYDNDESIRLEIALLIKSITDSFENLLLVEEVNKFFVIFLSFLAEAEKRRNSTTEEEFLLQSRISKVSLKCSVLLLLDN